MTTLKVFKPDKTFKVRLNWIPMRLKFEVKALNLKFLFCFQTCKVEPDYLVSDVMR